jgi:hypothetical protein
MCDTFKQELFMGLHSFDNTSSPQTKDTYKLALIDLQLGSPADPLFDEDVSNYTSISGYESVDAASPQGYTAGGGTLTIVASMPALYQSGDVGIAYIDFDDETFTSVNLSADGCLIYNSSSGNRAVSVHDFSGRKTASGGNFTVQMPAIGTGGATAILRLA